MAKECLLKVDPMNCPRTCPRTDNLDKFWTAFVGLFGLFGPFLSFFLNVLFTLLCSSCITYKCVVPFHEDFYSFAHLSNPPLWVLKSLVPYSQQFIFFVTYEWAKYSWVFVPSKPFQPRVMKHSSLLAPLVSYKENEVLWIRFLNYKRSNKH
jgi:hypothetical protein